MSAANAGIPADVRIRVESGSSWHRYPLIFGGAGLLCLALAFVLGRGERFSFSYLVAFLYGLSIALGGLFFVIIQYLSRAHWSIVIRRVAENVMGTLPLFALLFIPVALGLSNTHHHWWQHAGSADKILAAKASYLTPSWFFVRAAVYLAVWSWLALLFRGRSVAQDASGDQEITLRQQWLSAPAVALFALSITFAAVDWVMSMEPHWYSTIWGIYYFAGAVVAIFGAMTVLLRWLQRDGFLDKVVNVEHYHDLGKLLFGFTVFWSYIAFSQYFLIWYANIPEETAWFAERARGGWATTGTALIVCHFFIPFFFLISRGVKRNRAALLIASVWMLAMHYVDLYYVVMPVLDAAGPHPSLVDLLTLLGVLGLFAGAFAWLTVRAELLPVRDPRLSQSLAFENA